MKLVFLHFLNLLFIGNGRTESQPEDNVPSHPLDRPNTQITTTAASTKIIPAKVLQDEYLDRETCGTKGFSRLSCQKVFCPPWMRCLNGECICKLPYQCPKATKPACGTDKREYRSFCQVKALGCIKKDVLFSHFGPECKSKLFDCSLGPKNVLKVERRNETFLICGSRWTIAEANVACRNVKREEKGAEAASVVKHEEIEHQSGLSKQCIHVRCTGEESSLAECTFYKTDNTDTESTIATVNCYNRIKNCTNFEFRCVNGKCIDLNRTCDGTNDCGDRSDEVCCKKCRPGGFHCSSDVCIPNQAKKDGVMDCIGGDDEYTEESNVNFGRSPKPESIPTTEEEIIATTKEEVEAARKAVSTLECGISNYTKPNSTGVRQKRLLGGHTAEKGQIPWQVAIDDEGEINCGGIYIGGCWVLTAAHCVRPKPQLYRIKVGVWSTLKVDTYTDSLPVENVIIHPDYNPSTYQNDIALIQVKNIYNLPECIERTPSTASACVPWSEYQFKPGDNCIISGWGRSHGNKKVYTLKWANIEIIDNCSGIYGPRYFKGMECAGTLDGSVDTCQGDSGGPLVCKDKSGVSYVWGVVSWGEKCGVVGHPGVYTKVAHYFDWISFHVGRPTISKFNL
ncbi:complement factor I [Lepisosteus oculatus]|uniref:complement factor I n=1 Tax=Lepisosteus oculatus TaxID=7918 RepID=UPI0035F50032